MVVREAAPGCGFGMDVDHGILRQAVCFCMVLPVDKILRMGRDEVKGIGVTGEQALNVVGQAAAVELAVRVVEGIVFPRGLGMGEQHWLVVKVLPAVYIHLPAKLRGQFPVQQFLVILLGREGAGTAGTSSFSQTERCRAISRSLRASPRGGMAGSLMPR